MCNTNTDTMQRAAFSMLELVFVITILGIVSSIGAEIVAQVYENYILQRAAQRSSIKTELAANLIANRLSYAIPGTVIGRVSDTDPSYKGIENLDSSNYQILQWIGYDADSFEAMSTGSRNPGWSGFVDLDNSSLDTLSTPGSNLTLTNTIISNLSRVGSSKTLGNAALFFPGTYRVNNIGYGSDTAGVHPIRTGTAQTLYLISKPNRTVKEHYKLAWSSYAIVPTNCNADGCDLELRFNFQPWTAGSNYANAPSVPLLRNVTVFRFTGSGNTIRFKLCQQEKISSSYKITTCKEKAVIR